MNVFPVASQQSFPATVSLIVICESSVENKHFRSYPFLKKIKIKLLEMDLQTVRPILSSCHRSGTFSSEKADLEHQFQLKKNKDQNLLFMPIKNGLTRKANLKAI